MYFMEALQYPFNSKGWISKAVIAALLIFIPIVNIFGAFFLGGYTLRLVREILEGNMELPEFDYGADFSRGLTAFLYGLIYYIPMLIVSFVLGLLLGRSGGGQLLASVLGGIVGLVFGVVMLVAYVRYALTDETEVFLQVSENIAVARNNFGAIISYFINSLLFGLLGGLVVGIGFMLCFLPGAILTPMLVFGGAYMMTRFAYDAGLAGGKVKAKNFG